jgi:hypothetical protein
MRGVGAGGRIFDILGRNPVIPHGQGKAVPTDVEGVIRFENVKFHYPTRKNVQILDDFNLEIKAGETVAIVCVHTFAQHMCDCVTDCSSNVHAVEKVVEENHLSTLFSCGTTTQPRV